MAVVPALHGRIPNRVRACVGKVANQAERIPPDALGVDLVDGSIHAALYSENFEDFRAGSLGDFDL